MGWLAIASFSFQFSLFYMFVSKLQDSTLKSARFLAPPQLSANAAPFLVHCWIPVNIKLASVYRSFLFAAQSGNVINYALK